MCKHYDVSALPTVIFLRDGEVVSVIKGFNQAVLESELDELSK